MRPIGIAALFGVGLVACNDLPPPIAKDLHGDAHAISAALDQRALDLGEDGVGEFIDQLRACVVKVRGE
jgi:hypothetical protein